MMMPRHFKFPEGRFSFGQAEVENVLGNALRCLKNANRPNGDVDQFLQDNVPRCNPEREIAVSKKPRTKRLRPVKRTSLGFSEARKMACVHPRMRRPPRLVHKLINHQKKVMERTRSKIWWAEMRIMKVTGWEVSATLWMLTQCRTPRPR